MFAVAFFFCGDSNIPYTGGLTGEKLRVFSDPLSYERELWEVGSKTLIVAFGEFV